MRNIKLEIEYDGKNYCGWQAQRHRESKKRTINTIQETLENTLRKILQEKVTLIASGRTDAGVHARAQVANFKIKSDISLERLQKALNATLPDDIKIAKVDKVNQDFHSRFDAKSKVYRYTILNRSYSSTFLRDRVYFYPYALNVKLMQQESRVLLGRHNFRSFQAADTKERNPIRRIKSIKIAKDDCLIYIEIEADSFLYNMVRNIVGTLVEIGRGRFPKDSLKKILLAKDRKLAGPTAPAKGLCLLEVKY